MRLFFISFTLLFLSACMKTDTVDVPSSAEEKSTTQILDNKTDAQAARDEYKRLQELREKE